MTGPRTSSSLRNDRFAENGLPNESDLDPTLELREPPAQSGGMNPEKLAYILIGVCCGLSILCLIIVAVSIGYKTETHYRSAATMFSKLTRKCHRNLQLRLILKRNFVLQSQGKD